MLLSLDNVFNATNIVNYQKQAIEIVKIHTKTKKILHRVIFFTLIYFYGWHQVRNQSNHKKQANPDLTVCLLDSPKTQLLCLRFWSTALIIYTSTVLFYDFLNIIFKYFYLT
jgi:hypothetical protein